MREMGILLRKVALIKPPFGSSLLASMIKSVCIIEDAKEIREQFIQLIVSAPDMKCRGAFASRKEALPSMLKIKPDVVLMEIGSEQASGFQWMAEIKKNLPNIKIIVITTYDDNKSIFRALKSGADGYLIKSDAASRLIDAIGDAFQDRAPMSSSVARKVLQYFHGIGASVREFGNLSPREQEVLDLLVMGFMYREIGAKLEISSETVRTYVKNICKKMRVRRPLEAVGKHRAFSSVDSWIAQSCE